jgi:dipeptidase E
VSERHVVAMGGGGFADDDPLLDRYVLGIVDRSRPRICFVPTASGDAQGYIERFLDAFTPPAFAPSVLRLFEREVADVAAFLGEQDVVYVGGGNTLNMLHVWRLHGVDAALRRAWEAGVVMAGVSAGANCWFDASTTDSWLIGNADALLDGLGIVPGSFTPHYGSEPARRPSLHALVGSGELPDGLACDDFAAVHVVDTQLHAVVASRPDAGVYRVARRASGVVEEPLTVTRLG